MADMALKAGHSRTTAIAGYRGPEGYHQLDFTSEVTENYNARSDHGGGEAAHI